jgi:RNA recognition motif-containing protein
MSSDSTVFLCHLPYAITDDELTDFLTPFGTVVGIRKITDRYMGSRLPNGVAFVEFASQREALAVVNAPALEIGGRAIIAQIAKPRVVHKRDTAFVSGIPPGTTKQDVLEAFSGYRAVDAYVARANGAGTRGYAFVKFKNEDEQELAVRNRTHVTIGGEESVVRFANRGFDERPRKPVTRRGYRGRGRRAPDLATPSPPPDSADTGATDDDTDTVTDASPDTDEA